MCLGLGDKCDFALPLLAQEHTLCLSRHQVDPQLRAAERQQPQSLHAAARQHSHQENTDRDNCKEKQKTCVVTTDILAGSQITFLDKTGVL